MGLLYMWGSMFHPQQAGEQDEGSDMVTVCSDNESEDAREADEDRTSGFKIDEV